MSTFLAELLGTALLILLGNGVVANVCLNKSKGNGSGWIVIATGWALAVAIPVFIFGPISGGHFNPAVTLANASIGNFAWADVPMYILAQLLGAILCACLVFLHYLPHWKETPDHETKLGCFAPIPAIDSTTGNFISEFIGTFVLVFALLGIGNTTMVHHINRSLAVKIISQSILVNWALTGYCGSTPNHA